MKRVTKFVRDKLVLTVVWMGWTGFMATAKIKWLVAGPPLLRVDPKTLTTVDDFSPWVDKAVRTDVETFRTRRMTNRRRKVVGANWLILHRTEADVYYGRPVIQFGAGGFRSLSDFGVQTWYVVDKAELERVFPNYATHDGTDID